MNRLLSMLALATFVACTLAPAQAQQPDAPKAAYKKPAKTEFVRLKDNKLQVAVLDYVPADGSDLRVTLVGVIHIADKEYYQALQKEFGRHSVILYELVAEKGTKPGDSREESPFAAMLGYNDIASQLGLSSQLKEIDYNNDRFVHADLSFDEMLKKGRPKNADDVTEGLRLAADVLDLLNSESAKPQPKAKGKAKAKDNDPFGGLFGGGLGGLGGGDPAEMKKELAKQLSTSLEIMDGLSLINRYLIQARNTAVMEELDHQIEKGAKRICIFYGAGHNSDFHRRLVTEYGMKVQDTKWYDAWDLTKELPKQKRPAARPLFR